MNPKEHQDGLRSAVDGLAGLGPRVSALAHLWPISGSERSWLLTGRAAADRRRSRGGSNDLRQLLVGRGVLESRNTGVWGDFSGAMERQAVTEALASIRPELRDVVRLAYFEGSSNRELAGSLGISVSAARARLREALQETERWMRRAGSRVSSALLALLGWRFPGEGSAEPMTARELLYGAVGTAAAAAGAALMLAPAPAQAQGHEVPAPPAAAVQVLADATWPGQFARSVQPQLGGPAGGSTAQVPSPPRPEVAAGGSPPPHSLLSGGAGAGLAAVESRAAPLASQVTALPATVLGGGAQVAGGLAPGVAVPPAAGTLISGGKRAR